MSARLMMSFVACLVGVAPLLSGADGGCEYRSASVVDGGADPGVCADGGCDAVSRRNSDSLHLTVIADENGIGCEVFDVGTACPETAFRFEISPAAQNGGTFEIGDSETSTGVDVYTCVDPANDTVVGTVTITPDGESLVLALNAEVNGTPVEQSFTEVGCGTCGGTGAPCDSDADCCNDLCTQNSCDP